MSSRIPAGLVVAGKLTHVPLKDVSVNATINGYLAGLDSTLKYSNDGADPLEVVFRFPIEESFAIVGLEAIIAGRRIKADLREKEEARLAYDDALASGFTAALGEEKSGDIFSISLGNLPPKSEAELHLKLVGELPIDAEGGVRFALPSVLKPRYTPTGSTDPLGKVGGGADIGQVQQASVPAMFNFKLHILGADSVSQVTSPTHAITSATENNSIHVSLGAGGPLDKDLVILVEFKEPHTPKAIPEAGDSKFSEDAFLGRPAVMLTFFPEFTSTKAACEFIFVVDRSGSMGGAYIKSARETLILFLKSIPPGCHFNIIGFGSRYQSLFPKSVPYNQENLDGAMKHTETMEANLGGTELLGPLQYIFKQPLLSGLPQQVFVLTDGSVSNTLACVQEVKNNVKFARVFTFGIGSGASTALVRGLARAGNGTAEFIQEGERMQPKVISSLKRALQPSVTDLKLEFQVPKQYEVTQAPSKLPTLFNGDKVIMYGIFKPKSKGKSGQQLELGGIAILKGRVLDQPLEYTIPFQISKSDTGEMGGDSTIPIIHQLAAKSLIQDWQNGEGLHGLSADKTKKAIIDLSIEASVVSTHTAYVAVDEEQDKPIAGAIKTWDITAAMAEQEGRHGWGGWGRVGGGGMMRSNVVLPRAIRKGYSSAPTIMARAASQSLSLVEGRESDRGGHPIRMRSRAMPVLLSTHVESGPLASAASKPKPHTTSDNLLTFNAPTSALSSGPPLPPRAAPPPPPGAALASAYQHSPKMRAERFIDARDVPPPLPPKLKPHTASDKHTSLISLQQADGNWQFDSTLAGVLAKPLEKLESSCPVPCKGSIRVVWATILALVFLETVCASQRDEWELVAFKAEAWLQGQPLTSGVDLNTLKEAAKKISTVA